MIPRRFGGLGATLWNRRMSPRPVHPRGVGESPQAMSGAAIGRSSAARRPRVADLAAMDRYLGLLAARRSRTPIREDRAVFTFDMPTISMFYGILIRMFFKDTVKHSAPHVHAEYQSALA